MHPENRPTYDLTKYSNELYTRVFHELNEATTRFVVVYGGAASSKSYSVQKFRWACPDFGGGGLLLQVLVRKASLRALRSIPHADMCNLRCLK